MSTSWRYKRKSRELDRIITINHMGMMDACTTFHDNPFIIFEIFSLNQSGGPKNMLIDTPYTLGKSYGQIKITKVMPFCSEKSMPTRLSNFLILLAKEDMIPVRTGNQTAEANDDMERIKNSKRNKKCLKKENIRNAPLVIGPVSVCV